MTCDLVLPCRDEAAALPALLASVPAGFRPIVVDNGSADGTGNVAVDLGALVVREPRPGYGAAVQAGLEAATGHLVAVMDGDGSMDPADLTTLVRDVESGTATMSTGVRRPTSSRSWPWHARLGNQLALAMLRRRTRLDLHDIAPMRVCHRDDLLGLGVLDRRFGYPLELLIRAQQAGWTITEHDIAYGLRAPGTRSKVSGSLRGTVRTAVDFFQVLR
jgi:glycosyltransferase involved in cell wall biosynthesis